MLILQFISAFYCYLAAVYLVECLPIEKYLLDSTQSQTELNWDKEAFGDSAEVPGWKEQSFSQKNGDVWRVHAVCDISSSNPNNWLRLPYVSREQANRLIIKLEYTIRECKKYPGDIRSCKETFQLLYIESDNQTLATNEFSESNYKYLKTIAAVNNLHASPSSSFASASLDQTMPDYAIYRTEVELPLRTDKKGVYLVFRDQGACVSLLSVKIAYTVCSAQVTNLIEFPETRTGSNATDLVQQSGKCVENAESIGTNTNLVPYAYCQTNGNWFITNDNGMCMCRAGYSYSNPQQQCIQCPQGKYKPDTSNQPECLTCPLNSWSKVNASQFCSCLDGFYRFNSTDFAAPCIQYPNEPQNLTIYYLDQTSIKLRWNPIETNYIQANTVEYKLECFKCSTPSTNTSSSCKQKKACESYIHYPSTLTTNQVQLSSLDSNTQYMIEIYAQHTKALFKTKTIAIMARTYQDIASLAITNLTVYQFTEINQILLIWSNQLNGLLNKQMFLSYELRYWPKEEPGHANVITIKGPARNFTLKNSNPNVITNNLYVFQLRGQSSTGWGPFTQPVESMPISSLLYRTMPSDTDQFLSMESTYYNQMETTIQSNSNQFLTRAFNRTNSSSSSASVNESLTTVIMSTGIVLCFFIVAISLLVYFYRSNNCFMPKKAIAHNTNNISKNPITLSSSSSNNSDCDSLDLAKRTVLAAYNQLSSAAGTTISHSSCASGGSSPIWPGNHQTYIDPHTYEDPTRVVGLFAKELSPSNIIIESVIGGGEFGDVCKGMLRLTPWSEAVVAIKTLKGAATEQNRCDFLTEASIMAQFKDPNVVRLEGVVTQSHPLMIVTEYMENGSLDTFLRLNENKLKLTQMIQILHDVASGMRYLSDMNYIHRDLAARNILISRDLTCKVADFGLSRAIDSDSLEYTTKGGKIPIRWTAPEACNFRKYSYASDVWSFGVLAYEVLSFGERPYWNWENTDVIKALQESYRLPPPAATPDCLYKLMLRCWNDERMQRPRFNDIVAFLDQVVKCPVELNTQAKVKELMPINPRAPTQIQLTSTKQFLRRIKLEQYADQFSRQGLNNLANLFQLDTKQLTQVIQITNSYDQKVILDELERISQVFLHSIANNLSSYIFNNNTNSPQSSLHTVNRPQSTSIFQLIRTGSINNNNKNSSDLLIFNTQQQQQKGNGFLV